MIKISVGSNNHHVSASQTSSRINKRNMSQKELIEEKEKNSSPFKNSNLKNTQNSELDALIKEKESIEKAKEEFSKNSETMDPKDYQQQMKEYDKQIEAIQKQIHDVKLEKVKEKNELKEKNKKESSSNSVSSNLSEDNDKADNLMDSLTTNADHLSKFKSLNSLKKTLSNSKRIVDTEIKLDSSRSSSHSINSYKDKLSQKLSNQISNTDNQLDQISKNSKSRNRSIKNKNTKDSTNDKSQELKKLNSSLIALSSKIQKYNNAQNYYRNDTTLDYTA